MKTENRKTRWNSEIAAKALDKADASGLSDNAFAKELGVTGQRVSWWREKLGRRRVGAGGREPATPGGFVEVRARPKRRRASVETMGEERMVEIRLGNGRSLVVSESVDLAALEGLLGAVRGGGC